MPRHGTLALSGIMIADAGSLVKQNLIKNLAKYAVCFRFSEFARQNDGFGFASCKNARKTRNFLLTAARGNGTIQENFKYKAMRKKSNPDAGDHRERAMVEIPYASPDEKRFQAQAERGKIRQ